MLWCQGPRIAAPARWRVLLLGTGFCSPFSFRFERGGGINIPRIVQAPSLPLEEAVRSFFIHAIYSLAAHWALSVAKFFDRRHLVS